MPVAKEMVRRGTPYSGLLYAGLAWDADGPWVVEFNARFGDPETQPILALLNTPLAGLLDAVASGSLASHPELEWEDAYALTVVLAAENYPASPVTGGVISGDVVADPSKVLHAGTARNDAGELVSAGGRVLNIVGVGATLEEARDDAYATIEQITLDGPFYRRDIPLPAVEARISL